MPIVDIAPHYVASSFLQDSDRRPARVVRGEDDEDDKKSLRLSQVGMSHSREAPKAASKVASKVASQAAAGGRSSIAVPFLPNPASEVDEQSVKESVKASIPKPQSIQKETPEKEEEDEEEEKEVEEKEVEEKPPPTPPEDPFASIRYMR